MNKTGKITMVVVATVCAVLGYGAHASEEGTRQAEYENCVTSHTDINADYNAWALQTGNTPKPVTSWPFAVKCVR